MVQQVGRLLLIDIEVELQEVFEEVQVNTDVPRARLFPADFGQLQVGWAHNLRTIISSAVATVLVVHQTFAVRLVTIDTPTGCQCQHADHFLQRFKETFIGDVPTTGDTGEEAPLVAGTELGATVSTEREVKDILGTERIVHGSQTGSFVSLTRTGPRIGQITGNGRIGDATHNTIRRQRLRSRVIGGNLKTAHNLQLMLRIGKVGMEGQLMTGGELQVLLLIIGSQIGTTTVEPRLGSQRTGEVRFVRFSKGIHEHLTTVVELRFVIALT